MKRISEVSTFGTKAVVALAAMLTFGSSSAQAAGFSCMSVDRNERMDLFFDSLEEGASATELVVVNPNVSKRRQHVATFSAADGLLKTDGLSVEALVDTSFPESSRKGERIGGTTLGALALVRLDIQAQGQLLAGRAFAGQATYVKRSGQELTQDFDCLIFEGLQAPEELAFY